MLREGYASQIEDGFTVEVRIAIDMTNKFLYHKHEKDIIR